MEQEEFSYWSTIEPIWESVNTYDGGEAYLASVAVHSRSTILLHAAHFSLSEIWNGGLLQFFWNSTGVLQPEAVRGFQVIGMEKLASVLERAAEPLGSPYLRDREARWDAMLGASNTSAAELEEIFAQSENLYLAYLEATISLGWDDLDRQIWHLAEEENGGFQAAADRFSRSE